MPPSCPSSLLQRYSPHVVLLRFRFDVPSTEANFPPSLHPFGTPLLGLPKIPSVERHTACPLPPVPGQKTLSWFRRQLAKVIACSVLVVPPDFNGLLQAVLRGLVASRSRSWGSPCFKLLSHVCRAGYRAERSKSAACRVRCLDVPKATQPAGPDRTFPKEPVEHYTSAPSQPCPPLPKKMRTVPWRSISPRRIKLHVASADCPKAACVCVHG